MNGRNPISQIIASVLVNAVYAMINYPIMLVNTVLAPFSILLVITFVSHGSLIGVGIEGALIMTMISSGVGLQTDLSHLKNDFKLQDMIVSSPTNASLYVAGMGLSELVFAVPVIILLVILAAVYLHPTAAQALIIVGVMAICFAFSIVLGFLLSTFSSDIVQTWGFSGIVTVLLSTIPPVYYPITYIPLPFRYIAYLSPTTYAAQIVQGAMGFTALTRGSAAVDWAILIAVTIAIFAISIKKARWRET